MENIAVIYHKQGKDTEAEKLVIQVLDARNRILGVEHPETIRAEIYNKQGKYTEAEKLRIQVLNTRSRILGVEHPDTIDVMEDLVSTYNELGKYIEAEKFGGPSSGCKEQNSWSRTPRHNQS